MLDRQCGFLNGSNLGGAFCHLFNCILNGSSHFGGQDFSYCLCVQRLQFGQRFDIGRISLQLFNHCFQFLQQLGLFRCRTVNRLQGCLYSLHIHDHRIYFCNSFVGNHHIICLCIFDSLYNLFNFLRGRRLYFIADNFQRLRIQRFQTFSRFQLFYRLLYDFCLVGG